MSGVQKQGDFFVESPIILFAAIIWFLKLYDGGKYCTFPHAVEFLNRKYEDIIPILSSYPELENYMSPFIDAWQGGAADQLQGQIASAKIPLSRMISPQLYWVMSASEFTLDINNPKEPKILCVGNNPDRQNIYGAALGLYNSRIVKLINKKGMLKSSVIIDELPTIYFKGLDNLIATARSNKVAVCLGFQDFSQLVRDYGDKEAKVVQNTVGNIFSGQVVGETAKNLSERFGKVLQKRQSMTINRQDTSTSINTQMDSLIPASKISTLTQGMFVGAVSDNFDERIDQKIFHAEIVVDSAKVAEFLGFLRCLCQSERKALLTATSPLWFVLQAADAFTPLFMIVVTIDPRQSQCFRMAFTLVLSDLIFLTGPDIRIVIEYRRTDIMLHQPLDNRRGTWRTTSMQQNLLNPLRNYNRRFLHHFNAFYA